LYILRCQRAAAVRFWSHRRSPRRRTESRLGVASVRTRHRHYRPGERLKPGGKPPSVHSLPTSARP
jgi:hypothetical protein